MWVLLLLLAGCAGGIVYTKYQGSKAFAEESIHIRTLTADQITQIGTKRSGSAALRLAPAGGRMEATLNRTAVHRLGDELTWDARSKAGVMTFRVRQDPGQGGFVVAASASSQSLAARNSRASGLWGISSDIVDALFRALGVPRNPGYLLRQRKRVLNALAAADAAAGSGRTR